MSPAYRPVTERFWEKVAAGDPRTCWPWLAGLNACGYGRFNAGSERYVLAHRLAYEFCLGPIPAGLTLDHLCRNRACVNPLHLEPVPQATNVLRGTGFAPINAAKTHCPQGHPYDLLNTRVTRSGRRDCRACNRVASEKRRMSS